MKRFSIKLRKILLHSQLYYILLFCSIIIVIISLVFYKENNYLINDNSFILTIRDYKINGDKLSIEFKENLVGTYYFKSQKEKNNFNLNLNDKIKVNGKLSLPTNNTIPNTFNYEKYLYYKKINNILNIESYSVVHKNKNILYKIKNGVINRINNIKNNEYLYAFILGKSNYIDDNAYNNYKINGITHLFALSGLHVSLFSGILLFIFKKIKISEEVSFILVSIFLIFFTFIASFTPSILRATIFFILSCINKVYYLYIKPKHLLYLTFFILIIINPFYIFNTSFILSFTITFFILLFNEQFTIKSKLKSILVISIISFLSSVPIIINMSYEINIIGFINNIFFIPFVSYIVFPLSIITMLMGKLSYVLSLCTSFMEIISSMSSNVLNIKLIFSKMNTNEIIIYYILFILLIKTKRKKILFLFMIYIIFLYIKPSFNSEFKVYFLDVSQGDSTFVLTSRNESILIDTGGKKNSNYSWKKRNKQFNLMKDSMIPFFKSIGVKKINYLIITHGDFDHMGEAINLVNNFKVEKVIFNCGPYNDLEKELIKVLNKKKINYYSCIKELNIDKNKLYFLQTKEYDNENDNSNVIYTELNGYKFMFMGDASITTEKGIMNKYNLPDIDIIKVGHHGSRTSSSKEFINEINPKYSIISVGKNNRYGHPNKEVLDNLKDSKIYRTDKDGSIMFKIKNNKLKIETCSP